MDFFKKERFLAFLLYKRFGLAILVYQNDIFRVPISGDKNSDFLNDFWNIWIDTGGTFTDCLAFSPEGKRCELKLLSKGVLQLPVTIEKGQNCLRIISPLAYNPQLLLGFKHFTQEGLEIISVDEKGERLYLNKKHDPKLGLFFWSGEDPVVLACRLLTSTGLGDAFPPLRLKFGTTRATNAMLEGKGDDFALILSSGFEDLLLIGDQRRPNLFQLNIPEQKVLYKKRLGFNSNLDQKGHEFIFSSKNDLDELCQKLEEAQVKLVGISLLNAWANPQKEIDLQNAIEKRLNVKCLVATSLFSGPKYLERSQLVSLEAYLFKNMQAYLSDMRSTLGPSADIQMMNSTGVLQDQHTVNAKDSLLSGPAAGVMGAKSLAQKENLARSIAFDMGGTSTDVTRISNKSMLKEYTDIAGWTLPVRSIDIHTVAAGGGSICSFDGFSLCVGPESAGADPGPACYNLGGPLTITDLNLLSDRIAEENFPIKLNKQASYFKLNEIHERLNSDISHQELIEAFFNIANNTMASAIRKVSINKGYDPAHHTLIAYGGAGGLHSCGIAEILGISDIVIPYDAGIFSATGMGIAHEAHTFQFPLITPLKDLVKNHSDHISKAHKSYNSNIPQSPNFRFKREYHLRLKGQEFSLPIESTDPTELKEKFLQEFKKLTGYFPQFIDIEVEKLVEVFTKIPEDLSDNKQNGISTGIKKRGFEIVKSTNNNRFYKLSDKSESQVISGPASILEAQHSIYLGKKWTAKIGEHCIQITREKKIQDLSNNPSQLGLTELITNRLKSIAEEMGELLKRIALSINIRERLDFSSAVLDSKARLMVNAPHIPVHLGCLGYAAREMLKECNLRDGEVIITNHPAFGGSHIPDITLLAPVHDSKKRLIAYVMNRAHHAEIGGLYPGSMSSKASNLEQEGVVIRPQIVAKNGEILWDTVKEIFSSAKFPSRAFEQNKADLMAAFSSLEYGKRELITTNETYGRKQFLSVCNQIYSRSAAKAKAVFQSLKEMDYSATEHLDDGRKIAVHFLVNNGKLMLSLKNSDGVSSNNLNAPKAIAYSVLLYVIRLLVDEDIPMNDGLMENVDLDIPTCMFNPKFIENDSLNPAVSGGNTELSQRLTDTMLKALKLSACSQGTMNNLAFGNDQFGYYETIGGGTGATKNNIGRDAVHQHMTNTKITDAEIMEINYPVKIKEFSIREGSGGDGENKGGNGIKRCFEFTEDCEVTLVAQHNSGVPFGLMGGENGKSSIFSLQTREGKKIVLSGLEQIKIRSGELLIIKTPGGGGWGNSKNNK